MSISNLIIDVLTPSERKLRDLRNKYDPVKRIQLEKIEDDKISSLSGLGQNDYHRELLNFNLSNWKEDISIENGSCIVLLTELLDKRILWLADSHPSDVTSALKPKSYTSNNKLICNWVKVAHHGSVGNSDSELYSLINCNNYLFSANGENKFHLPAKETIARILRNPYRNIKQHYLIVFTYDNPTLRSIFINEKKEIYQHLNFSVKFGLNRI